MTARPEVLLVDLSSLFWTAHHAVPKEDSVSAISVLAEASVRKCVAACEPGSLVAVCLDVGRSFRKDLLPEYKAQRPEKDASVIAELRKMEDRLRRDGFWLVGAQGFEADDVIATLCHDAVKASHPVCIASADKDLLQLLALPDVRQLRTYNNWDVWRSANVVEKFGVEPEGLGDWLALVGDVSDNVKGVPTVGAVTATKLLLSHGDLDGIFRKVNALTVFDKDGKAMRPEFRSDATSIETKTPAAAAIATPAIVDKLWRFEKDARLARKLVELRTDAPVKFEDIYEKREVVTTTNSGNVNLDADDEVPISRPQVASSTATAPVADAATASAPEASTKTAPTATTINPATEPASAGGSESTAIATRPAAPLVEVVYERQLEPRSAQAALTLGEVLHQSRAFGRFPTAQAITAAIMMGRELGFPAMASLNMFQFLAELNCLAPKAHTIIELGTRHPKCKFMRLVESTYESATYETWHKDHQEPYRHTYTIQDAVDAGLATLAMVPRSAAKDEKDKRGQWDKRRKQMLRKTAGVQIVTIVYPGASMGMIAAEELRDMGDEDDDE